MHEAYHHIDSYEGWWNRGEEFDADGTPSRGYRTRIKGGYFPVPPQDSAQDMRGEMLAAMASMGVKVEKHHHEVASAQHELGMKFDTLVHMGDQMQIYKYAIHNVAQSYGKTAKIGRAHV